MPRPFASLWRVVSDGMVSPRSVRLMIAAATPARRPSSAWDQPRRVRSSASRNLSGVMAVQANTPYPPDNH
jgi:hypothetical protein